MTGLVRSVNLARPRSEVGQGGHRTGIDKRAVECIEVFAPREGHGHGSGVVGDLVGNARHHGGADKAVYAFSREELNWWERELRRGLPDGTFGENLTTKGLDLESLRINQRLRVGDDVVLEVSIPRQPCATFQRHLGEPGWTRRFTSHGRCGAYLRVRSPGVLRPGDAIDVLDPPPSHDIDIMTAFAAAMGDRASAARVVDARCLPMTYHEQLTRRLRGR
ncbi:MAG: MOSC domain-containing protein [Dermatophilaceae bacterium]|nr:MOSC domain-containing protein [Intrasporangiaceae bacterium]